MNILNTIIEAVRQKPSLPPIPVGGPPPKDPTPQGSRSIISTIVGAFDPRNPGELPKTSEPPAKPEKLYFNLYAGGFKPAITPRFVLFVGRRGRFKVIEKDEEAELTQITKAKSALCAEKGRYSPDAARLELKRQNMTIQALYRQGKIEEARNEEVTRPAQSIDEVYAEHRHRISNIIREWEAKKVPIVERMRNRLVAGAIPVHAELAAEDRAACEDAGIPFTPSPITVTAGQLIWRAETELRNPEQFGFGL